MHSSLQNMRLSSEYVILCLLDSNVSRIFYMQFYSVCVY